LAALVLLAAAVLCAKKNKEKRAALTALFINGALGLYIADFFLMPFAYGEIDIEKLPFHVCTAMCVLCFASRHNAFLGRFKYQFAMMGFVSNVVYLIYPAGLMWHRVSPLCYRVMQTLLFHSVMAGYGLLVFLFEDVKMQWEKDLAVIGGMAAWAVLGNLLYTGEAWGKEQFFNWFFVVRDPFYILPESISPFIMPFFNTALFFAVELAVYALFGAIKKKSAPAAE
ncbi:MAG: hypothetical protein IKV55_03410, partial [Oscillospiraceae bacterium]|nr:hypothetical protein [Oscillospiraceae bacterium]